MQVTGEILDAFAIPLSEPEERKLSGFEIPGDQTIGIDDTAQTYLDIVYIDRNTSLLNLPANANEFRSTLVIPKRPVNQTVGEHGYLFAGLIKPLDLKKWFIETFKPEFKSNEDNS